MPNAKRRMQPARPGGRLGPTLYCWWYRIMNFVPNESVVLGDCPLACASSFMRSVVRQRLRIFEHWSVANRSWPAQLRECQRVLSRCPRLSTQCRRVLSQGGASQIATEEAYTALCEGWLVVLDAIARSYGEVCTAESMWPPGENFSPFLSARWASFTAAQLYLDGEHFPTAALNTTAASFLEVLLARARARGRYQPQAPRGKLHIQIAFLGSRIATRRERQRSQWAL